MKIDFARGTKNICTVFLIFQLSVTQSQTIESSFKQILDSTYDSNQDAVGMLFHVEAPNQDISWTASVGYSEREKQNKLDPNQPVLIASNTKTYVATAILVMVEKNMLKLDDSIEAYLSKKTLELMRTAKYSVAEIKIKNLLSHTSGIGDYVDEEYLDFVNENRTHQWTRDEQIQLAMKKAVPLGKPGEGFKYGDINYLLLTEIIENLTDKPFYTSIRGLINYQKLGLKHTWFKDLEPTPKGVLPFAHQYWDKYEWDSYDLNHSWDLYGGGGLASTTTDVAIFFQALFNGQIIHDSNLLKELTTFILPKEQSNYCLGLRVISFHGNEAYYHGGFWGTDAFYLPELNTTMVAFTLQKEFRELHPDIKLQFIQQLNKSNETQNE